MPMTVGDPSRRGRRLLPVAVFLCVAGAHIWMIWMAPSALSFSVRHIHTDNAVMLLMGKHMLEKGEFPIFYYGQEWFGSLSAVVHAGVFLVLGGIPPWSIHAAPLLFFLGFCLVLYRLARDTLGPAVALWALAWNIATPVHLAEYAVMPHGGYVESLMLGTLLLWLAVRLVMARGTRRQRGYYALLGFVGGVAWWTSPLVVYQILASGIYVVMRERMTAVLKGALLSLPAFFLGAAPFFYFYAVDPYSSVLGLGGGYALANIPTGLSLLVTERLPEYLDWTLFPSKLPFAYGLAAVVYGASTLALLWHLRRSFRAQPPLRNAAIFPIFFLVVTLLLTASIHIRRNAPQYALPLSAFFPVAVAFCLVHAPRRWRLVTWSGCAAVFLLHGWTTAAWVARDAPHAESATRGYLSLIRGLEANGVARLYIPATPGSEILNFYARERVIASQVTRERYPPNFEALERDPGPAFLFPRGTDTLTPTLKVLGASQETERVGGYDLIRHVRPTDRRYRQVPGSVLRGSASHEAESMGLAVDRNMDSAWESVQPRTPGMWVELDLGTPVNVGMVRLWNRGQDHGHYAMELRVETSLDGTAWRDAVPRSAVDYYYTSGPRVYPWEWGYRWEARFAPVRARRIRISQHEDGGRYPWKIAEAYVYEDWGAAPRAHGRDRCPAARCRARPGPRVRRPVDERADIGVLAGASRDDHALHGCHAGLLREVAEPGDPVGRAHRLRAGGRGRGRVRAPDAGRGRPSSGPRGLRALGAVPCQGGRRGDGRAGGRSGMVVDGARRRANGPAGEEPIPGRTRAGRERGRARRPGRRALPEGRWCRGVQYRGAARPHRLARQAWPRGRGRQGVAYAGRPV